MTKNKSKLNIVRGLSGYEQKILHKTVKQFNNGAVFGAYYHFLTGSATSVLDYNIEYNATNSGNKYWLEKEPTVTPRSSVDSRPTSTQSPQSSVQSSAVSTSTASSTVSSNYTVFSSNIITPNNLNDFNKEILLKAIKNLINKHIELALAISGKGDWYILKEIKFNQIISTIQFDNLKDEEINCHLGAPPYLLRHIFNQNVFQIGTPLWKIFILDNSMIYFHGQAPLFDIYSCANFHNLLLIELNQLIQKRNNEDVLNQGKHMEHGKKRKKNQEKIKKDDLIWKISPQIDWQTFPRSIFDNSPLYIPNCTRSNFFKMDFTIEKESFIKSIYFNTMKKPLDFLINTNNNLPKKLIKVEKYGDLLDSGSELCGRPVFGTISIERFNYLNDFVTENKINFKSLIVGLIMLCLKPSIKDFNGKPLVFSIRTNLRHLIKNSRDLGLYYKDIRISVPLSLLDNDTYKHIDSSDVDYNEKMNEEQFNFITRHVNDYINERIEQYELDGPVDYDLHTMKKQFDPTNYIQINDLSQIGIANNLPYKINNFNFTTSLNIYETMSISYTLCGQNGLNVCVHHPENNNFDSFLQNFQQFLED